jgi:lysine 2,3-aminomutase
MKLHFAKVPKPEFVSLADWNSWTWQLRNSLKSQADFERAFTLSAEERAGFSAGAEVFNIRSTPYYASLAGAGATANVKGNLKANIHDPLRRILMPNALELATPTQAMLDPLGERKNNPVSRIIHRYPDRVLFLITDVCSVYCRYCTRKHFTGQEQAFVKSSEYEQALAYVRNHPGIREVILSGGDPLTVGNAQLERTLFDLRKIEHVEVIRIGSRMPVVCPQRIDTELVQMLRRFKPVFLMAHFNHPRELTEEAATAVELFVDHGIPVMNQMVLLNGVNNHPAIVQALSRRLLYLRAKPYYMFQCDPSRGTDHLRTSIEDSLQIQKELWGNLSGLAMPTLSVDIPDGGGKTTYAPNFETASSPERRSYVGWDGVEADYINPPVNRLLKPQDAELYQEEWDTLRGVPGPVSGSPAL